jgi:hypothetical protein
MYLVKIKFTDTIANKVNNLFISLGELEEVDSSLETTYTLF